MAFNLFPKDDEFYRMFKEQADRIAAAGEALKNLAEVGDGTSPHVQAVIDLEEAGDRHTRAMVAQLNKTFVTPVDREDIHLLTVLMDDILDLQQAIAVRYRLFEMAEPFPPMRRMAALMARCAQVLQAGVDRLPRFGDLSDLFQQMQQLESEGDEVNRAAVADLLRECRQVEDVVRAMKWKEIVQRAEDAVDKFKDVFELLQEVVVKHA